MMTGADERMRRSMLKGEPFKEGHYWLGDRFVRVSATLYPAIKWWVEDCHPPFDANHPALPIDGTRRQLSGDDTAKLRSFV